MAQLTLEGLYDELTQLIFSTIPLQPNYSKKQPEAIEKVVGWLTDVLGLEVLSKSLQLKVQAYLRNIRELEIQNSTARLISSPSSLRLITKHCKGLRLINLGQSPDLITNFQGFSKFVQQLPGYAAGQLSVFVHPSIHTNKAFKPLYFALASCLNIMHLSPNLAGTMATKVSAIPMHTIQISAPKAASLTISLHSGELLINDTSALHWPNLQSLRLKKGSVAYDESHRLPEPPKAASQPVSLTASGGLRSSASIPVPVYPHVYRNCILTGCRETLLSLSVFAVQGLNETDFWVALKECPKLHRLCVSNVPTFSAVHLLAGPPPSLDFLTLEAVPLITPNDVCMLLASGVKLRYFLTDQSVLGDEDGVKKIDANELGHNLISPLYGRDRPFWVAGLISLAEMYLREANWTKHATCTNWILARYPSEILAVISKAEALALQGLNAESLEMFNRATDLDARSIEAWAGKAQILDRLERKQDAIAAYYTLIKIIPGTAHLYGTLAALHTDLKQHVEALACIDKVLHLAPEDHRTWCSRGLALQKLLRFQEAYESFDKAIALHPIDLYYYRKGECYRKTRKDALALDAYRKALERNPKYVPAHNSIGLCYLRLGNFVASIQAYNDALQYWPTDIVVWCNKGEALFMTGHYTEAIQCCDTALKLASQDDQTISDTSFIHVRKAKCFVLMGSFDNAIECLDKALKQDSEDANAWEWRGRALFEQHKYQESVQCYEKGLSLRPNDVYALGGLALASASLQKFAAALVHIDKAIELEPENDLSHRWKGRILMLQGDKQAAFAAFDRALELCANHTSDNLYRRGMAYFGRGDYLIAEQTFAQGLQIDPSDSDAWFDRGESLRCLGRLQEAVDCYRKALELCPYYKKALKNLEELAPQLPASTTQATAQYPTAAQT